MAENGRTYKEQVGFIRDNEKNLSFEARRAIYALVRSSSEQDLDLDEEGVLIENHAQNATFVRLDRLSKDTLSAICRIVEAEKVKLNQPARPQDPRE